MNFSPGYLYSRNMKSILAAFGLVALIDYIPDSEMDLTRHALSETGQAGQTVWNGAVNTVYRIAYTINH